MAIAFDQAGSGTGSGTSLTFNATVGTGIGRVLFVGVADVGAGDTVTGVTFNGVAMTKIQTAQQVGAADFYTTLWYLVAPASGTHSVVVSASASASTLDAAYAAYSGVNPAGVPDSSAKKAQASATSVTGTTTSVADNCWAIFFAANGTSALVAGASSTLRVDIGGGYGAFVDTNGVITPAGARNLIIAGDGGTYNFGGIIASFAPSTINTSASTESITVTDRWVQTTSETETIVATDDTELDKNPFKAMDSKSSASWENEQKS